MDVRKHSLETAQVGLESHEQFVGEHYHGTKKNVLLNFLLFSNRPSEVFAVQKKRMSARTLQSAVAANGVSIIAIRMVKVDL